MCSLLPPLGSAGTGGQGVPCLWLVTCSGTPAFPGSQCSWGMAGVRGWVTLWHHSCLCSGWEERGPSESCQPTAQMPQMPGARSSQQKQWGISRRHINCERTPSPRQNLPTPTSGGTGTTCLLRTAHRRQGGPWQSCSKLWCARFSCRKAFLAAHLLL